MNPELEQKSTAFIRSIANRCNECLRRSSENCSQCPCNWAKSLLDEITAEKSKTEKVIDYSLHARIIKILSILNKCKKPILSKSIKINTCSFQLKLWTLKSMQRHGFIHRSYAFSCANKKFYQSLIVAGLVY